MAVDIEQVKTDIATLMGSQSLVEIKKDDLQYKKWSEALHPAKIRLELTKSKSGPLYTVDFPMGGSDSIIIHRLNSDNEPNQTFNPPNKAKAQTNPLITSTDKGMYSKIDRTIHSYVVPKIANDFIKVLTDKASHVVWLTGPTRCGKDMLVHYAGKSMGRKVYQINCKGDMDSAVFFGEKTIVVDDASKQNKIVFQQGQVEQACREGLDENGKEVGEPAILFITEAAAMPSRVAIGINRLLESDDASRTLVIDTDGGRIVRSHSGLRIVFASNTIGRGSTSMEASAYSAQTDALDISLLNRISVCFRMGYDKEVERHILEEKIGDDSIANLVLQFRDAIRKHIREGKLVSPFSTGHIVHIADMYRVFGDIGKAIYYVCFEFLMPEEKAIYNEQAHAILGKDLLLKYTDANVDYM